MKSRGVFSDCKSQNELPENLFPQVQGGDLRVLSNGPVQESTDEHTNAKADARADTAATDNRTGNISAGNDMMSLSQPTN